VNTQKRAYRTGFVSYELLAALKIALRRCFTTAADRPAGTREALPGTKSLSKRWNV